MTDLNYCPKCGQPSLGRQSPTHYVCLEQACAFEVFQNVAASASTVLVRGRQLLVIRRAREPGKGLFCFPGGFVDPQETLEQTAARELMEELGLQAPPLRYLGAWPNEYEYKDLTYQTIDSFFTATWQLGEPVPCQDEVAEVCWLDYEQLSAEQFAFPSHAQAWQALCRRMTESPLPKWQRPANIAS